MSIEHFDNILWKVIFKHLTPETRAFIKSEFENAELKAGVTQALAERERVLGIIEDYNINMGGELIGLIERIKNRDKK